MRKERSRSVKRPRFNWIFFLPTRASGYTVPTYVYLSMKIPTPPSRAIVGLSRGFAKNISPMGGGFAILVYVRILSVL